MFAICSPAYGSFPFLRLFGRSGAELLINRVGGETSPFQEDAVANHDDAIESQAGLRAVPCDELLDGVLVDAARTRRRETVDTGAPLPYLLQNDYRTFVAFFLRDVDPNWDGTYVTV